MMNYAVSDQIQKETTKCEHGFSCIKSGQCGDKPMCEVEYSEGVNFLFLKSKTPVDCPYNTSFGRFRVCKCPTRCAIYNKYR
jgi:hypothetical protein